MQTETGSGAMPALTPRRKLAITLGVMTGLFLSAMETTVVGTAMPTIIAKLGGLHIYSWVFAAYILTSTISIPLWGGFSDRFGHRRVYLIGIVVFLTFSALSGLSRTITQLIFFRALQGIGGGALLPLGMTIVGAIYSLEQRAKMQGMLSGVFGLASLVGPLIGGFLSDHKMILFAEGWRWVFYVNVPIGLISLIVISIAFPKEETPHKTSSIDFLGIAVFAFALTSVLSWIMTAGTEFPWLSVPSFASLAAAIFLCVFFVSLERRAEHPIFNTKLFSYPMFARASLHGFFTSMAMFGAISFIPLYVQGVNGTTATQAGKMITPFVLTWVFFSMTAVRVLLKIGSRKISILGSVLLCAAFGLLAHLPLTHSTRPIIYAAMLAGAGMGFLFAPLTIAVQNAVPREVLGATTSSLQFFRNIGAAVGISAMGKVMSYVLQNHTTADMLQKVHMTAREFHKLIAHPEVLMTPVAQASIDPKIFTLLRDALYYSLRAVFFLGFLTTVAAVLISFTIPEVIPKKIGRGSE